MRVFLQSCATDCRDILNNALWVAVRHCCLIIVKDILCSGVTVLFMDNLITYAAGEHLSKKHQCYTRIATLLSTYKAKSTSNECGLAYKLPGNPSSAAILILVAISLLGMILLIFRFRFKKKCPRVSLANCMNRCSYIAMLFYSSLTFSKYMQGLLPMPRTPDSSVL